MKNLRSVLKLLSNGTSQNQLEYKTHVIKGDKPTKLM